jgi:hypothetical protein
MGRLEADRATTEGPWQCERCGREGILRVFAAATVVNARAVRGGAPLERAIQAADPREAERNARVASSLAKCPACHRRPIGPHLRLVAQVLVVGSIVGSGVAGAAGFMMAFVHDPGPGPSLLEAWVARAMVVGFALGTLTTASAIYFRRLANVARWGKFVS